MSIKDVALASARRGRSRGSFAGVDNKVREDFAVLLDTNDSAVQRELNNRYIFLLHPSKMSYTNSIQLQLFLQA